MMFCSVSVIECVEGSKKVSLETYLEDEVLEMEDEASDLLRWWKNPTPSNIGMDG